MYLITPEKRNGNKIGTMIRKKRPNLQIYKLEGRADAHRFSDGVICWDLLDLLDLIAELREYEKR